MTAKELIDHLSQALLCDERVLSAQEKELLSNILQQASIHNGRKSGPIFDVIARAVGETVAQRAFGSLGDSITRRVLQQELTSSNAFSVAKPSTMGTPSVPSPSPSPPQGTPRPPSPGPPAPGISVQSALSMGTPSVPSPSPSPSPPQGTPRPPSPGPPATGRSTGIMQGSEFLAAQCVVLDEFLAPAEVKALMQYAVDRETEFHLSEVISPGVSGGLVDYEHRRSRVLYDLGKEGAALLQQVEAGLPRILPKVGHEPFPISRVEAQITASNHGDYFRWHCDDGHAEVASRLITFVYFFHREPKEFSGGELRIYDSRWLNSGYAPTGNYRTIVPQQNQLVIFPSALAHEITPLECPSGTFAGSRFTVNGWFHR
jgi:SM-20-related protein